MGQCIDKMDEIKTIAILGTGSMGVDLGLLSALHGFDVILWHRKDRKIAHDRLINRLEKYTAKEILTLPDRQTALDRITVTSRLEELSGTDIVIETIVEDLAEKSMLLNRVALIVSDTCIVVSNTSSLSIEDLASHVQNPDRFAGLHFFNPALKMELVEIIACSKTSSKTIIALRKAVSHMGKTAVEVKDSPGFIVNRLMACQMREAISLVEQGVASPEDIDVAMKLGLAHPIGPLALADLIGLDVMVSIFEVLHRGTGSPSYAPPQILIDLVAKGWLGRKAGQGFFAYGKG